ncbi:MAG: small acid-soluble spore protein SspI [Bacilli bacterium]
METEIRKNIKHNFKDDTVDLILKSVDESINNKDEILLPGLGVFFEILWNNSSNEDKINYCNIIEKNIK